MLWLGIETSCDETAVALVRSAGTQVELVASIVSSQIRRHQPYGGVVPELAVREHLRNLPQLVPQILERAKLTLADVRGLAVTEGPGLASSLLIGHSYARGLALAQGWPLIGINHLEGHLFSPFLTETTGVKFPFVGLVVSGGHTLLVHAQNWLCHRQLGRTVDDAAGEVFDKVARLVGLGYPGGPAIEQQARLGDPHAYEFPQSFPERDNFNFSFSGLKTSVRYFLEKHETQRSDASFMADVCASFQHAVVQVLVRKTVLAAAQLGCMRVAAAGGVLCNESLREKLATACAERGLTLHLAPKNLCTDNAAMIAAVAALRWAHGQTSPQGLDINPNLPLGS